jgi:hypothetical protein
MNTCVDIDRAEELRMPSIPNLSAASHYYVSPPLIFGQRRAEDERWSIKPVCSYLYM